MRLQDLRHGDHWAATDGTARTYHSSCLKAATKRGYCMVVRFWKGNSFHAMTLKLGNYLKKEVDVWTA